VFRLCTYSRLFRSSVVSGPLYDDQDHHSTAERAFPYDYGSLGLTNACNQLVGQTYNIYNSATSRVLQPQPRFCVIDRTGVQPTDRSLYTRAHGLWRATKQPQAVWQLQPKVVQTVKKHVSHMNLSGYVEHVTIFSWILTIVCCLVIGLGLDIVSGW